MQTVTVYPNATHRSVTTLPNGDRIVWLASKTTIEASKISWNKYNSMLTKMQVHTSVTELSTAEREMTEAFYNTCAVRE